MTQAEIEAEFGSLRARLSQLEEAQELRTEQWRKLGPDATMPDLLHLITRNGRPVFLNKRCFAVLPLAWAVECADADCTH